MWYSFVRRLGNALLECYGAKYDVKILFGYFTQCQDGMADCLVFLFIIIDGGYQSNNQLK